MQQALELATFAQENAIPINPVLQASAHKQAEDAIKMLAQFKKLMKTEEKKQ
jgi:hypothetical protein